jgi:tetratricopeptide (TPR) repeat protein
MRKRSSIVIRSDDHLGDSLGMLFLLEPAQLGDTVIEKLREYLGDKIQVIKAEVSREKIEVEVETVGFRDESDRLVEATAGLRRNRLYRSAEPMLEDALKLDPLNPRAMIAMGEVYQASEKYSEAVAMLIRAREASPNDTADLFAMIGACCLKAGRNAAAIAYLERAVSLDSRQFSARRALIGLGRKPVVAAVKREPTDATPAQRKPHVKH